MAKRSKNGNRQLGYYVSQLRSSKGWSQQALANRMGKWQSVVADLELGNSGTSIPTLAVLADALDLETKERVKMIELAGFRLTGKDSK